MVNLDVTTNKNNVKHTLESRIIGGGGVGIIGGLDTVIIVNNRASWNNRVGSWTGLKK